MATILDGRAATETVMQELAAQVAELKKKGVTPGLALVLTGEDKYSARYVGMKQKKAEELGLYTELHHLEKTTQKDLVALIHKLNRDPRIHGVMVQLPLAEGLSEFETVDAIDPSKDVDGQSPSTLGRLLMGEEAYVPAGPEAIMELLKRYGIDPENKHWVVVGKTNYLSKPLAAILANMRVRVTVVGPKCPHLAELVKQADVLSTEMFTKNGITGDMLKKGVVVIDNGNNYEGKKVFGDVDAEAAMEKASAITPVPGGVGPMLIAMLLKNTIKSASIIQS